MMDIEIGKWYIFKKSGRHVKVVEQCETAAYFVERADGSQFYALATSLEDESERHPEDDKYASWDDDPGYW